MYDRPSMCLFRVRLVAGGFHRERRRAPLSGFDELETDATVVDGTDARRREPGDCRGKRVKLSLPGHDRGQRHRKSVRLFLI